MRPSVEGGTAWSKLIAAAGRALIARSGYDAATSWRDVAREAGVSTGVIAYYFRGQGRPLRAHVLRRGPSRGVPGTPRGAQRDAAETPRERLLALAEARNAGRRGRGSRGNAPCGSTSGAGAPRATPRARRADSAAVRRPGGARSPTAVRDGPARRVRSAATPIPEGLRARLRRRRPTASPRNVVLHRGVVVARRHARGLRGRSSTRSMPTAAAASGGLIRGQGPGRVTERRGSAR